MVGGPDRNEAEAVEPPGRRPDTGADARVSRIALLGLVLIGVGLVEAIVGLLAATDVAMTASHAVGHDGHLPAFVGMVLVFVGVLRGAGRRHTGATSRHMQREDSDAVR